MSHNTNDREHRNSSDMFVRHLKSVPVTEERKPFINTEHNFKLYHAGTARANIAASAEKINGIMDNNWLSRHKDQTVLQQHCEFFDRDQDGIIWPRDTFVGFYRLRYGIILSLLAVFIIHTFFTYPTLRSWIPDPFFCINIANIHKDKHGSDTGTYDNEGRFIPQKFEEIFTKYADGKHYLTLRDAANVIKGQRCIADPVGWGGAMFEWIATYILLWPEDGRMMKEDIRGIYDGSLFYTIAARRLQKREEKRAEKARRRSQRGQRLDSAADPKLSQALCGTNLPSQIKRPTSDLLPQVESNEERSM